MLLYWLITAALGSITSEIKVGFAISKSTPTVIVSNLLAYSIPNSFEILTISMENFTLSQIQSAAIIVDMSYSLIYSVLLKKGSESLNIPLVTLYHDSSTDSTSEYVIHSKETDAYDALQGLLNYLVWDSFILVTSPEWYITAYSNYFINNFSGLISNYFILTTESSQTQTDLLVAKMIKTSSIRKFVIIASAEVSAIFVNSLNNKNIYVEDTGVIVFGEAVASLTSHGVIGIVEPETLNATNSADYSLIPIRNMLSYIHNTFEGTPNSLIIPQSIQEYFVTFIENPGFLIVNINDTRNIVGTVVKSVINLNKPIVYPGGATYLNKYSLTTIVVSYAGGADEQPPTPQTVYNPQQMQGALYALSVANHDKELLPNFNFSLTLTDCGVVTTNLSYIKNCLNNTKNLGAGFLSHSWSQSTQAYIEFFAPKPVVSQDVAIVFSNETLYPTFTRIVPNSNYIAVVVTSLIQTQGWTKINVVYSSTAKWVNAYKKFLSQISGLNIQILNDESLRQVPIGYTRSSYNQTLKIFQNLYDSGARIFLSFLGSPDVFFFVEGLYDIGFRRGDIQIIQSQRTGGDGIITSVAAQYSIKRSELYMGCIGLDIAEWIGDYGEKIEKGFIAAFSSVTAFRCTPFDSLMLLLRSIANVIKSGFDYEDPSVLNKYIRLERFVGCTGTISIAQNSNDRSNQNEMLYNLYMVNGSWIEQGAAIFDPSNQSPFEISQLIVWNDGTTIVPKDYRFSLNCPFDETKSMNSTKGFIRAYCIYFSIAIVAILFVIYFMKNSVLLNHQELNQKKIITAQDMTIFVVMIVEVFQYIALGVTPSDSSSVIGSLSEYFSINFKKNLVLTGSAFWTYILGIIVFIWIFLLLTVMILLRKTSNSLFKRNFFSQLDFVSEYVMPIIGDLGIIPVISAIFSLYDCTLNPINSSETYNSHDCNQYCWTGPHLAYSIVSFISLVCYFPVAFYFRPLWQSFESTLNILTNAKYMYSKTVFQVTIIAISKTVAYSDKYTFTFLYTGLILFYAFYISNIKAFNYGIANHWLRISLFFSAFTELLYSISVITSFNSNLLLGVLVIGLVFIFSIGFYLQRKKFETLLVFEASKDLWIIIEDVFGKPANKYRDEKSRIEEQKLSEDK